MLGYSPIAGSALASSGHEIIVVSLDHGSFTFTGQAAEATNINLSETLDRAIFHLNLTTPTVTLVKTLNVTLDSGSFALTGQDAVANVSASLGTGSFAVTGQDNSMIQGKGLPGGAEAASYVLTGQDVTVEISVSAVLDHGSFTLTGIEAGAQLGELFEPGGFTLSGQDSTFTKAMQLTADHGSFAATGQDLGFDVNVSAILDNGAISLTYQNVDTGVTRAVTPALYALTGQDVDTPIAMREALARGTFIDVRIAADFVKAMNLSAANGSFALSGQAIENFNYSMSAGTGSFALTGFAFLRAISDVVGTGSFALSGQAINFKKTANLEEGSFSLVGFDLETRFEGSVGLDQGSIALTGQSADFEVRRILVADAGSFALTGQDVDLTLAFSVPTDAGSFTLSGDGLTFHIVDRFADGDFSTAGQDVTFILGEPVEGVSITVFIGGAAVYGLILPDQDPNWARVTPAQDPQWTLVA